MSPNAVFIITALYWLPGKEGFRQVKNDTEKWDKNLTQKTSAHLGLCLLHGIAMPGAFSLLQLSTLLYISQSFPLVIKSGSNATLSWTICPH